MSDANANLARCKLRAVDHFQIYLFTFKYLDKMSESIGKIFSNLGDNPYFGAGFGLVGVGAGIAAARQAVSVGLIVFKRHCMMTLEVTHRDQAYPWLLNWLTHYHKSAQHLSVVSNVYRRSCGNIVSQFNFVPSVGTHFLQ